MREQMGTRIGQAPEHEQSRGREGVLPKRLVGDRGAPPVSSAMSVYDHPLGRVA